MVRCHFFHFNPIQCRAKKIVIQFDRCTGQYRSCVAGGMPSSSSSMSFAFFVGGGGGTLVAAAVVTTS